jgi:UDP-glucose 4-epimerase
LKNDTVLVTGGAGYIGSHTCLQLIEAGRRVIILDDLSNCAPPSLDGGEVVIGNVADAATVTRLLRQHRVTTVIHLAAKTNAADSVYVPTQYYAANTCATLSLLASCAEANVSNFVFTSTAAVYGNAPAGIMANEDSPTHPINPYGASKLMSERMLSDHATASGLRFVALRCFNVAGCDLKRRVGPTARDQSLLIQLACQVAAGKRSHVSIFGTDFPTPDGTAVRDYLHVADLARALLDAITYLEGGGRSTILNCGYGRGYSVREVLRAVERAAGGPIPIQEQAPRVGDVPHLIADATRIRRILGWVPRCDDIDLIASTALAWERSCDAPTRQFSHCRVGGTGSQSPKPRAA